jgi:hypothetical protein
MLHKKRKSVVHPKAIMNLLKKVFFDTKNTQNAMR